MQHTTVIRAADQREVGSVVPKLRRRYRTHELDFALVLRIPSNPMAYPVASKVFQEKLTKERSHCSGATLGR